MANDAIRDDLARSGLNADDIKARELGPEDLATLGLISATTKPGYVIPYYGITGQRVPHYRVKFVKGETKYMQPKNSGNFVYFPPNFYKVVQAQLADEDVPGKFILVTEGEKKAAKACKDGFPACALGGVNSWRTRTLLLPEGTELSQGEGNFKGIRAQIPAGVDIGTVGPFAQGIYELVNYCKMHEITIIICFDTDQELGIKPEVQTAAASFGIELRGLGVSVLKIRQLVLPWAGTKVGLDDYLLRHAPEELNDLIGDMMALRTAFPRHPDIKRFVSTKLTGVQIDRKKALEVGLAVVTELDASGMRLQAYGQPFYFDADTHRLMTVELNPKGGTPLHETSFGQHIYKNFGLNMNDSKLLNVMASQITGEPPIEDAEPSRVVQVVKDESSQYVGCPAFQLSDSHFVIVTPFAHEPVKVVPNGSEGILFEQGHVEAVSIEHFKRALTKQSKIKKIVPWWKEVLEEVSFDPESKDRQVFVSTILYYISPYLHQWRGMQLPVEIIIGEAGSGKSSLYSLRLQILTGKPYLRNMPADVRDWYSSVLHTGGLHVIDNVVFTNKDIRQRISDEMCRITTEPYPHIEMRKLYTTSTVQQIPVSIVFGLTAIAMPFTNADLVQRAQISELQVSNNLYESDWVEDKLKKFGGRAEWLAHQSWVLHKFLVAVKKEWNPRFQSPHRLAHYEQVMTIMGKVLGFKTANLTDYLTTGRDKAIASSDWTLEALVEYSLKHRQTGKQYSARHMADWFASNEDYEDNKIATNARSLGRYMMSHKETVRRVCGLKQEGTRANRMMYSVLGPEKTC